MDGRELGRSAGSNPASGTWSGRRSRPGSSAAAPRSAAATDRTSSGSRSPRASCRSRRSRRPAPPSATSSGPRCRRRRRSCRSTARTRSAACPCRSGPSARTPSRTAAGAVRPLARAAGATPPGPGLTTGNACLGGGGLAAAAAWACDPRSRRPAVCAPGRPPSAPCCACSPLRRARRPSRPAACPTGQAPSPSRRRCWRWSTGAGPARWASCRSHRPDRWPASLRRCAACACSITLLMKSSGALNVPRFSSILVDPRQSAALSGGTSSANFFTVRAAAATLAR